MNLTLDWNAMFNTLTVGGLVYMIKLVLSLASTVKELQTSQKAEAALRASQIEAVHQRIDDLRDNGRAVVRH